MASAIGTFLVLTVCTTEIHADVAEESVEPDAIDPQSLTTLRLGPSALSSVFETQELLSDTSCRMKVGAVETRGLAVVWIRRNRYTHFQVVDSNGVAFEGGFESRSIRTKYQLGRNPQGDIILGFVENGDLHIVNNGLTIHSDHRSNSASDWGIARNGSRFFKVSLHDSTKTIEVGNSQGKILKSRTLPLRQDERIMLASWPSQRQGHYFTRDYRDIEFFSISEPNARTFYSADSKHNSPFEKSRDLTGLGTVRFESRNVAYMLSVERDERGFGGKVSVTKRQWIERDSQEASNDLWTRSFDIPHLVSMSLSKGGKYVIVHALNIHVLDSNTGESLLAHPTTRNLALQVAGVQEDSVWGEARLLVYEEYRNLSRELLSEVQDSEDIVPIWDGSTRHGISLASLEVVDDTLRFVTTPWNIMRDECRRYGKNSASFDEHCIETMKAATLDECDSLSNVYAKNKCREDLTELNIVYTFDLTSSSKDSRPQGRFAIPADDRCYAAIPGWGGLQWTDGELTYVTD
ncbi:MAG: hypothetical protein OXG08_00160 [Gammaproteobacteria bacterium]|nr:hypothetical protein [Gammaproteobacteria bacterium]